MNNIEIITYATHNEGTFNELIKNKYNIPITVLGWGNKWKGFMDKLEQIYNYINKLSDDKIIIIIDGFDSKINSDLNTIYTRFYKNE